jgi:hypothetical protein
VIVTLALWAYAAALALAYGDLALRLAARWAGAAPLPGEPAPGPGPAVVALVGLAALGTLVGATSLLGGVGAGTHALLGLGAAAHAARTRPWRRPAGSASAPGRAPALGLGLLLLLVLLVLLVLLERTAGPVTNYDSGLYHAQAVRWIEEHGAAPGLGNLHGRLAFSAAWFVLTALFGLAFLGLGSFHAVTGLVTALFALHVLGELRRPAAAPAGAGLGLLLLVVVLPLFGGWLSSPTPDVPVALLTWLALLLFVAAVEERGLDRVDGRTLAIALLAAYAVALKPSAAPVGLLPAALAARHLAARRWRPALVLAGLAAAVLLPAVVRSVVASGYLVYPFERLGVLPVDWRVSAEAAADDLRWLASWARLPRRPPDEVLTAPLGAWVPAWYGRLGAIERVALVVVAAGGPAAAAAALWRRREPAGPTGAIAVPFVATLGGTLLWFLTVPDRRFGWGVLLGAAGLLVAWPLRRPLARTGPGLRLGALGIVLAIQAASLYAPAAGLPAALAGRLAWPADYPVPEVVENARGAVAAWAPRRGNQCWYRPFPCTPYRAPDLEPRGPGPGSGYRVRRP